VPLGIYISVPFCRTKCSFCNFASGVFSSTMYQRYVGKVCADIENSGRTADQLGGEFDRYVDSIYLGGGTPTVLAPEDLTSIFKAVGEKFEVSPEAEITVECAPGTLTAETLNSLLRCGVNRVSLGVQSFVDEESRSVGRLHTRSSTLEDIARLRAAGITNISVDLIAGLPHQTRESWTYSLEQTLATEVPHVSVYMLEVDEDSRLGRELLAGGTRYHAHFVPDEDLTAELYVQAIERLNGAGIFQYEISNFARTANESLHNLKYWTRQPYLGFGVDAHSMLPASSDPYVLLKVEEENAVRGGSSGGTRACAISQADVESVRFCAPDSLDDYLAGAPLTRTSVSLEAAREEEFFLGLRLNRGVDLDRIARRYGLSIAINTAVQDLTSWALLERTGDVVRLTNHGRLVSNEVFQRFLSIQV
jgi:oxygen-independent coproporphyrinogen III oxidase